MMIQLRARSEGCAAVMEPEGVSAQGGLPHVSPYRYDGVGVLITTLRSRISSGHGGHWQTGRTAEKSR